MQFEYSQEIGPRILADADKELVVHSHRPRGAGLDEVRSTEVRLGPLGGEMLGKIALANGDALRLITKYDQEAGEFVLVDGIAGIIHDRETGRWRRVKAGRIKEVLLKASTLA